MVPGELKAAAGELELNAGRETVTVQVTNAGDRPVQVGSHYHFFEANDALRFEPGQTRTVELVALAGGRKVYGFAGKVMGALQ